MTGRGSGLRMTGECVRGYGRLREDTGEDGDYTGDYGKIRGNAGIIWEGAGEPERMRGREIC